MTPTDLRAALRDLLTDRDEYDGDRLSRIEAGLRALADALPVTPADLPAAERCPRCNDPCCDVPASTAATNGIPGFGEMCSEDDGAKWAALGRATRECHKRPAVDWRARALAAEAELAGASAAICDVSDTIRRALDGDEGGMRAPYHGPLAVVLRYPSIAADLRRLDEVLTIGSPRAAAMRDAAARWAKVAPLIERLRVPDGRPLYADIMTLLAATEAAP